MGSRVTQQMMRSKPPRDDLNSNTKILQEAQQQEMVKYRKRIKEYAIEMAESSTTHAIDRMVKTDRTLLRVLWILFFVASTGACGYFIANTIMDYLEYDVVTKIQAIYEVPQIFPSVSVCNLNIFNNNQSLEFAKNALTSAGLTGSLLDSDEYLGFNMTPILTTMLVRYLLAAGFRNPNLTESDLQYYGIKYEDFVLSCTFNLLPCNSSMFKWSFDIRYGSCFKFNAIGTNKSLLYTYRPESFNGLRLELYIAPIQSPYALSSEYGAVVVVQNASETRIDYKGVKTKPGTETSIRVK